jgi:hypothetical protein
MAVGLKLIRSPIDSCAPAQFDLSVCPSMSLAAPRLHSLAATHRGFTFYVADPVSSIETHSFLRGARRPPVAAGELPGAIR